MYIHVYTSECTYLCTYHAHTCIYICRLGNVYVCMYMSMIFNNFMYHVTVTVCQLLYYSIRWLAIPSFEVGFKFANLKFWFRRADSDISEGFIYMQNITDDCNRPSQHFCIFCILCDILFNILCIWISRLHIVLHIYGKQINVVRQPYDRSKP